MNKRLIAVSVLVLSAVIAIPVFAQTTTTTPTTTVAPVATTVPEQPILQVGAAAKYYFAAPSLPSRVLRLR